MPHVGVNPLSTKLEPVERILSHVDVVVCVLRCPWVLR